MLEDIKHEQNIATEATIQLFKKLKLEKKSEFDDLTWFLQQKSFEETISSCIQKKINQNPINLKNLPDLDKQNVIGLVKKLGKNHIPRNLIRHIVQNFLLNKEQIILSMSDEKATELFYELHNACMKQFKVKENFNKIVEKNPTNFVITQENPYPRPLPNLLIYYSQDVNIKEYDILELETVNKLYQDDMLQMLILTELKRRYMSKSPIYNMKEEHLHVITKILEERLLPENHPLIKDCKKLIYIEKTKNYPHYYQQQKDEFNLALATTIIFLVILTPLSLFFTLPRLIRSIENRSLSRVTMTEDQYGHYKDRNRIKNDNGEPKPKRIKNDNGEPKPKKFVSEPNNGKVTLIMDEAQYQRNKETFRFFQKNHFKDTKKEKPVKTIDNKEKSIEIVSKFNFKK